ncbi:hypothetical protein [Ectopseudomonas toyotomiensis]|uniref:hypothetical protein n=1 Tax=Ectopseudomonas toyotomiensis TaxID=554344 RepID=UPI00111422F3|nr:hypothetical protein [Pseudomonas toyotomiensis]
MKPEELKQGDWLVIRDPLADREYRAQFVERLPSLGYGDSALNRLSCADWIGQPGADAAGRCTFTDSELAHHGRVLLDDEDTPVTVEKPDVINMALIEAAHNRREENAIRRLIQRAQRVYPHLTPLPHLPAGTGSEVSDLESAPESFAPAPGAMQ